MSDLVVIGAGPAGLFCAINCAKSGMRVCILEKNDVPARKLLISGSGRCNITNASDITGFESHYGSSGRFVKSALYNFSNTDMMAFFQSRNLRLVRADDGKIFPESLRSEDVLNILLAECVAHNVEIRYGEPVEAVIRADNADNADNGFIAVTGKGRYASEFLMIATGGKSYPSTGSTGDGYRFAASLGHSITETAPALAPVIIRDYRMSECSGIAIRGGSARLFRDGKKIREQSGDILFTHRGLSGPGILDLSRYVRPDDFVKIQMTGFRQPEDFEKILTDGSIGSGGKSVKNFIVTYGIPERIAAAILKHASLPSDCLVSRLDRKSRRVIAECVTGMSFRVEKTGDYNEAMATRGGVAVREVYSRGMESKIMPGLFFAGEVLDVDGDTGGYNLQFAFSSAKSAADHMTARYSRTAT